MKLYTPKPIGPKHIYFHYRAFNRPLRAYLILYLNEIFYLSTSSLKPPYLQLHLIYLTQPRKCPLWP
jgi:hypothetical protein